MGALRRHRVGRAALLAAGLGFGAVALAQTVDDSVGPAVQSMNLPNDLTVFGKVDPNVRKATAIVNGTIITQTDIEQRLALVLAANGGKVEGEERERLKLQVLRNLIDETLQIQEAKARDIVITPPEIQQTYTRVAGNFKRTPATFGAFLREQGSSEASIKRQIEGELAWRRLLSRRIEPFVNVGDDEVAAVMARINANKGAEEFRIGEIFLSSTPETSAATLANANRIVEQVRKGGSFLAYARQFSEASTAAVGGDLGWVRAEQLPPELATVAQTMQPGSVSVPIAVPGGYSIIAVVDRRTGGGVDARDAVLALKQVSIKFPAGVTREQVAPDVAKFGAAMKTVRGCGSVEAIAKTLGAEVVDNDQIPVRGLPAALQQMMLDLQIGQASPPFGSVEDGVRSLVLCGRDEAKAAAGPDAATIQSQLEEERVNRSARRYLRDLRRDAVVDYR
ncbi:peptidylprolyl isomerase [Sphingomonas prati]|uniref:Parvulin-like PPIase n=1 Tax=Sphingomonas prati TaxID=1843237 RepID=A0A7W9BRG1_9SPHN|nr:peptidyl-prolyl cis-trans isomerase SurA [Sphingomonas prati]GGE72700.1 chaperone SurA [Sphingomonas prati]